MTDEMSGKTLIMGLPLQFIVEKFWQFGCNGVYCIEINYILATVIFSLLVPHNNPKYGYAFIAIAIRQKFVDDSANQ
jgi:hypothetical protein